MKNFSALAAIGKYNIAVPAYAEAFFVNRLVTL